MKSLFAPLLSVVLINVFIIPALSWRCFHQLADKHVRVPVLAMNSNYQLGGYEKFQRINPKSDKFSSRKIHHVEFYTGEATAAYMRFMIALGMKLRGKSDYSTGNKVHASYLLQSKDVRMVFTSPYPSLTVESTQQKNDISTSCWPGFDPSLAESFITKHGLAVRAIGIEVDNVQTAHDAIVANGGKSVLLPTRMQSRDHANSFADIAEISLYGDVVMRLVNRDSCKDNFLPGYEDISTQSPDQTSNDGHYRIEKFDHIVGNVDRLEHVVPYIQGFSVFIRCMLGFCSLFSNFLFDRDFMNLLNLWQQMWEQWIVA